MKEQLYQLFAAVHGAVLGGGPAAARGRCRWCWAWPSSCRTGSSHAGTIYSQKFNINLITLTVLTATVMTVISATTSRCRWAWWAPVHRALPHGHQGRARHHVHLLGHHLRHLLRAWASSWRRPSAAWRGVRGAAGPGARAQRRAHACWWCAPRARRSCAIEGKVFEYFGAAAPCSA